MDQPTLPSPACPRTQHPIKGKKVLKKLQILHCIFVCLEHEVTTVIIIRTLHILHCMLRAWSNNNCMLKQEVTIISGANFAVYSKPVLYISALFTHFFKLCCRLSIMSLAPYFEPRIPYFMRWEELIILAFFFCIIHILLVISSSVFLLACLLIFLSWRLNLHFFLGQEEVIIHIILNCDNQTEKVDFSFVLIGDYDKVTWFSKCFQASRFYYCKSC